MAVAPFCSRGGADVCGSPGATMPQDGGVPQPLDEALAGLRPFLNDLDTLVRAVGAGRRRGSEAPGRVEVRPVDLNGGRRLQVVRTAAAGSAPVTVNHAPDQIGEVVAALLAQPFGNWHIETLDKVVQLRVTKRGEAQVHVSGTSRRVVLPGAHDRVKQHLLDPSDPLFDALGADADKRRQVDAFLRQLAVVADRAASGADDRPVRVVDLGCGNAYLTFAAHRWLAARFGAQEGVRTLGIDHAQAMVDRNTALAAKLGMTGLTFQVSGIADAEVDGPVDLVLALHACDTATDDALARAVRWQASAVLAAPCCHHDLHRRLAANRAAGVASPAPYQAVMRHAVLAQRWADVLTDTLRAEVLRRNGYRVDVVEFVDSRHTPRNALIRAERADRPPGPERRAELEQLCDAWQVTPRLAELLEPGRPGSGP